MRQGQIAVIIISRCAYIVIDSYVSANAFF